MHTLIAHEDSGYEDWGANGALRVNPSPSGRGLSLTLRVIHASFKAVERFITLSDPSLVRASRSSYTLPVLVADFRPPGNNESGSSAHGR